MYQKHSPTSRKAWLQILPDAATLRGKVYSHIVKQGVSGATDEEICDALNIGGSTERPRRIELIEGGFVADSARQRHTRSGRLAAVWVAAKYAKA